MEKSTSDIMIKGLVAPVGVWAVSKLLERPAVKGALKEVDSRAFIGQRMAMRRVRRVRKNAMSNPMWLAAGAAAIAVGISLMAKAAIGSNRRK